MHESQHSAETGAAKAEQFHAGASCLLLSPEFGSFCVVFHTPLFFTGIRFSSRCVRPQPDCIRVIAVGCTAGVWGAWREGGSVSCVTCHVACCTSCGTEKHVTRHTSHVTRHTSHVTRHTSHVTRHTSHVTRHTSHVTQSPRFGAERASADLSHNGSMYVTPNFTTATQC